MFTASVIAHLVIYDTILILYDIIMYKYIKLMDEFIDFWKSDK